MDTHPRILGELGRETGPVLVCVGGLHGNEPAGIEALERVVRRLSAREGQLEGRFVALSGNLTALERGQRFIDHDLNRSWTTQRVAELLDAAAAPRSVEEAEQAALLEVLHAIAREANGPVFALDIHTTSGRGGAFVTVADSLPNRAFATQLPAPMILGLEELIDGTMLEYLGRLGFITAGFEGGQHQEPEAVERIEAALWIAIAAAGLLPEQRIPELTRARKRLARDSRHLPRVLEMRHRHPVVEGDGFRMRPGYENFQKVERDEVIARDHEGDIRAPESARLLMPLYQTQGEDGFFVVREFAPFWLHVSYALRRLRLGRLAHWLPGIRRHPVREDALVVDKRLARFYAREVLHLFGFRRLREEGDRLVVLRRPLDS